MPLHFPAKRVDMAGTAPGHFLIPEEELRFQAVHASGPGGQGVNTASSAVVLRWNLRNSVALPPEARGRMAELCRSWLTQDGEVVIDAREFRSQLQNRLAARTRLEEMARKALKPPRKRRKTRVPKAEKERRIQAKKRRGERLRQRRPDAGE